MFTLQKLALCLPFFLICIGCGTPPAEYASSLPQTLTLTDHFGELHEVTVSKYKQHKEKRALLLQSSRKEFVLELEAERQQIFRKKGKQLTPLFSLYRDNDKFYLESTVGHDLSSDTNAIKISEAQAAELDPLALAIFTRNFQETLPLLLSLPSDRTDGKFAEKKQQIILLTIIIVSVAAATGCGKCSNSTPNYNCKGPQACDDCNKNIDSCNKCNSNLKCSTIDQNGSAPSVDLALLMFMLFFLNLLWLKGTRR